MSSTVFALTILCLVLAYIVLQRKRKPQHPYPPGPPPKPIIGNALDIPFKKPWFKYLEWSKKFDSGVVHLCALDHHIVVLNKMEDVVELMGKRSIKYSGRPLNSLPKLLGIESFTGLLPYGNTLRKHRKFLEDHLGKDIIHTYRYLVTEKVHIFLEQLLRDPAGFDDHCNTLSTSVSLATTFGYDLISGKNLDPFVEAGQYAIASSSEILLPGRTLIGVFPFLRHIPPWFPGATSQRFCAQIKDAYVRYGTGSFEYVKRNMASGIAKDCITKRLLETGTSEDEEILKNAIMNLSVAGLETTQIGLVIFILTMTVHQVEQQKAQQEIDQIVGSDRLPTFGDRPFLPYVEALYREVLRWRPVLPLGFPRATEDDDVYQDRYIPQDSIVLPNVWAITRDETTYPDPEEFRPERFFKEDGSLNDDNVRYVFGFGRRICPGEHMADLVLWLMIASVLAVFNIARAKDEDGNVIEVDASPESFTDTLASRPLPFKCSITARSKLAESLIRDAADTATEKLNV